jgi:hypothetical protein
MISSGRNLGRYGLELSSRSVEIGECADKPVITVEGGPAAGRVEQMADAVMADKNRAEVVDFVLHHSPTLA